MISEVRPGLPKHSVGGIFPVFDVDVECHVTLKACLWLGRGGAFFFFLFSCIDSTTSTQKVILWCSEFVLCRNACKGLLCLIDLTAAAPFKHEGSDSWYWWVSLIINLLLQFILWCCQAALNFLLGHSDYLSAAASNSAPRHSSLSRWVSFITLGRSAVVFIVH